MVFLLKITVVRAVIAMHMRAQNAHWLQSRPRQRALDQIALRAQPRIEQHTRVFRGFIKRDDLPILQIPGIARCLF